MKSEGAFADAPNPLLSARKRLGITQAEMAEKLGVAENYVYLMESGRKPVSAKVREPLTALESGLTYGIDYAPVLPPGGCGRRSTRDGVARAESMAALRAELAALRSQNASLTRLAEAQAQTIERMSRGVCRYPEAAPVGPTQPAAGAASRAG